MADENVSQETRNQPDPVAMATMGRQTSQIRHQTTSEKPRLWRVQLDVT